MSSESSHLHHWVLATVGSVVLMLEALGNSRTASPDLSEPALTSGRLLEHSQTLRSRTTGQTRLLNDLTGAGHTNSSAGSVVTIIARIIQIERDSVPSEYLGGSKTNPETVQAAISSLRMFLFD